MKIDVKVRGIDATAPLREHTMRRLRLHLSRFGNELSAVVVRLVDVNGPRGGEDMRCQITVRGPRVGSAAVAEQSDDAFVAVELALERLARAVRRRLDRAQDVRLVTPRR